MKVEFSSASVVSIPKNRSTTMAGSKKISPNVSNLSRINSGVQISFKGNTQKNYSQFLSIAPEDKGLGIPEYNQGGLAVVTQEAPESWNRNLKADSRTILPYHSYDNPDGGIKVLRVPYENGKPVSAVDPKMIRSVGTDYQLKEGERFVIQSAPSEGKSKFIILEKLGIQGSITRLNPDTLEKESVPYHLFKAEVPSDSTVTRYILHTPDLAKFPKAYNPGEGAYSTAYSSAKT